MNHKSQKMLEDTTKEKQVMGSSNTHWKTRTNNDAVVVPTGCKTTEEGWTTVEGGKDRVAEDRPVKSSIATTVSSESKQTGCSSNRYTSSHMLEEETDPTSSPSEMEDEPDRKCTESPIDSDRAVRGSTSVHSESSESSTEHNDSRKNTAAVIDLDKVEAMGGQFDGLGTGRGAASFHNPVNDVEARYINDKVIKANTTMEDINLRPEVHFRDHGSSFQVSARPKEPFKDTLDAEGDIADAQKVPSTPDAYMSFDRDDGEYLDEPKMGPRRSSHCCIIM
ncbi:MAG: hypothetical protein ALECFALPRED_007670 [Alectoria fallacina]|uniref:Uncharacterized protein n=1 Tax=Alectoria fallacina TaxID=1903189 RepID=A0A8H3EUF6_9LECA|nr:MAG: hypothetical protein ALECFALPRED_007670 [Alectoria fallacina]